MLSISIKQARERVESLRRTIALLRSDSEVLSTRREAFLGDGERFLARLLELDADMHADRERLSSDSVALLSRLEREAVRISEEWIEFRRALGAASSVQAAACAIPSATPSLVRAASLVQLLRRMESGPGSVSLKSPNP